MPRKDPSPQVLGWKRLLAITIGTPLFLWVLGYCSSRIQGCDPGVAIGKACVHALSWIAGWLVFAFVLCHVRPEDTLVVIGLANVGILEPKEVPWPFPAMLQFGVLSSMIFGLIAGLVLRVLRYFVEKSGKQKQAKLHHDEWSELA